MLDYAKLFWYKRISRKQQKIMITQKELNSLIEKPKCEIEEMYSLNMYILLLALSYLSRIPLVTPLCLIYLSSTIFTDKFLLNRFYAEPSRKKENLATRLIVSSGFLLKFWYFNIWFGLLDLQFSIMIKNKEKEVPKLVFWMHCLQYTCLVLFFVPFEILVRLQIRKLDQKRMERKISKNGSSDDNSQIEHFYQQSNFSSEEDEKRKKEIIKEFNQAFGYFDERASFLNSVDAVIEGPESL